jgi:hypothetical protein
MLGLEVGFAKHLEKNLKFLMMLTYPVWYLILELGSKFSFKVRG